MADDRSRRGFQRDRTFAKFEASQRRWSAINDSSEDSRFHTRANNGSAIGDNTTGMLSHSNISLSNISDTTSPMHSSYSVNSNMDTAHQDRARRKLTPLHITAANRSISTPFLDLDAEISEHTPSTPEPALLGVKQKLIIFENLKSDEWLTITPAKSKSKSTQSLQDNIRRFVSRWEMDHKKSSYHSNIDKDQVAEEVATRPRDYDPQNSTANGVGSHDNEEPSQAEFKSTTPTFSNYLTNGTRIAKVAEDVMADMRKEHDVITRPKSADFPIIEEDHINYELGGEEEDQANHGDTELGNASSTHDSLESWEGEFEPSVEAVNKPFVAPVYNQYVGYDREQGKSKRKDQPELIELIEEDEEEEDEDVMTKPSITYFSSIEEDLSEDEVTEYLVDDGAKKDQSNAGPSQSSVASPSEEFKVSVDKPFLSPAFLKYMSYGDEPPQVTTEDAITKPKSEADTSQTKLSPKSEGIGKVESNEDNSQFGKVESNEDNSQFGIETSTKDFESSVKDVTKSYVTPTFTYSQTQDVDTPKMKDVVKTIVKEEEVVLKLRSKDFQRKYRSLNKYGAAQALQIRGEKYSSLRPVIGDATDLSDSEMCTKGHASIQPILEELLKTEQTYVESLWTGLNNYGNLFEQRDLPKGLKGKKFVLFGNIEQIAEFHRDEFLPMLQRNRHDLKRLFDEFQQFIEQNCFYAYVLYAMNNQRSLELCNSYKRYFKLLQTERNDNLGINSFLLQPIQRVARYPLLLREFMKKLFDNYPLKPMIDSCCRLDKKMQNLLNTTNKSEVINDIACLSETHEFNIFYQGKFRDVGEFHVFDHSLKRSYRSKVFVYDKCVIYTEIKRKEIMFRGRYPRERIGISGQTKSFTLFYERHKQQECDFMGEPVLIKHWYALICDIISSYAEEERTRLKQWHCRENGAGHMPWHPANLLLFRDSNRFSSDSSTV